MTETVQRLVANFLEDRPTMKENNTFETVVSLLRGELDELVEIEPTKDPVEIKQELADVLIFAYTLAHVLGVDAEEAIRTKVAYNTARYTAEAFKEGSYTQSRSECRDWVDDRGFKKAFDSI